jgi:hypothetical protein
MKKNLIVLFCTLLVSATVVAADKAGTPPSNPLLKSDTVVWAGLDYSMVRMYGTLDFLKPEDIFPAALESWNNLFINELVFHKSERLQKATGKTVKSEIEGVVARNKLAKTDQIIRQDGNFCSETHIKDSDIAEAVRSYKLTSTNGLGLVFIVDRLVKVEKKGAVYLVYFDIAKREVIAKERVIVKAAGFGFRNYWFRVPKDALPSLKKLR